MNPTESPDPAGEEPPPMTIEVAWVRERMQVPDLERLLSGPQGARISDNFDSLRVRLAKAVDRIAEEAGSTCDEIRRRAQALRLYALSSAVLGILAVTVALAVPAYRVPAALVAVAELLAVLVLRSRQRLLARALIAASGLAERFRPGLEAARSPADLSALGDRIRREMAEVLGAGAPPEAPPSGA